MAKFGLNAVRFHFLDSTWGTPRLINYESGDWRNWNADALDRLDYFIARLKEHGIYADLNLLVGRRFGVGDGVDAKREPTRLEGRARRRLLPCAAHGGAEAVRAAVAHAPQSLHETHLRRRPRRGAGRDQQRERPDPHLAGRRLRCPARRVRPGPPEPMEPVARQATMPARRALCQGLGDARRAAWPRRCSSTPAWPGTWKAGTSSSTRTRRSMRRSQGGTAVLRVRKPGTAELARAVQPVELGRQEGRRLHGQLPRRGRSPAQGDPQPHAGPRTLGAPGP